MNKCISGPWMVINSSWKDKLICDETGNTVAQLDLEKSFDVNEDNQDECEELALSHANLIAAAPDLLEALERVVAWVDKQNLEYESAMVRQARSAIAKARGEQYD